MTRALSVNVAGGHTWWNMRMLIIQTWRELNGEDKGRTQDWVLRGVPMGFSGSEMAIGRAIFFWAEHWRLGEGTGWWQGPVYSQDSGLLPSAFPHKHMEKIRKEEPDIICFRLGSMYSTLEKSREGPSGSWLCGYAVLGPHLIRWVWKYCYTPVSGLVWRVRYVCAGSLKTVRLYVHVEYC